MGSVTMTILEAVADEKNCSPDQLTPPLQEAVDVDAVEQLLNSGEVELSFVYDRYRVTASSSGDVEVTPGQVPN